MAVLDRDHAARDEALAVADAVDLVDDGDAGVAGAQEIGVQRMRLAVGLDGARGGDQRLPDDLTAENPLPTILRAATAEEVVLERLQVEDAEQVLDGGCHGVLARIRRASRVRAKGCGRSADVGGEVKRRTARDGGEWPQPDILIAGGGSAGLTAALAIKRSAPDLADRDRRCEGARRGQARRARFGDRRRGAAHARSARRLAGGRGRGAADPFHGDHRQPHRRRGAADLPHLRRRVSRRASPSRTWCRTSRFCRRFAMRRLRRGSSSPRPDSVERFAADGHVDIGLASGETRQAKLLVAADGIRSRLRALAGIKTVTWGYPQTALVATVRHERPHNGVAVEHFLPSGPFAILPLTANRSSLVWTERARRKPRS